MPRKKRTLPSGGSHPTPPREEVLDTDERAALGDDERDTFVPPAAATSDASPSRSSAVASPTHDDPPVDTPGSPARPPSTTILVTTPNGTFTVAIHRAAPRKEATTVALPMVMLIHGFPDLPEPSFAPLAARFVADGYTVAIPHLRGYESATVQGERVRTGYFLADLGLDLLAILGELRDRRFCVPDPGVVLVGHDWGSAIVQTAVAMLFEMQYDAEAKAALDRSETSTGKQLRGGDAQKHRVPRSMIRAVVLLAVPPLQHFLLCFLLYPVQLLYSWYMFFFQLPFVPERALRSTRLIAWLWQRWDPAIAPQESVRRAEAVRDHLVACGRPIGTPAPSLKLPGRSSTVNSDDALLPVVSSVPASRSSHGSSVVGALGYYRCMFNVLDARGRYSLYLGMSNNIEYLAARTVPALGLSGSKDGCVHPKVFAYCCKHVRHMHGDGIEHVQVPDAGHFLHQTHPDQVYGAIVGFLGRRMRTITPAGMLARAQATKQAAMQQQAGPTSSQREALGGMKPKKKK